MKKFIFFAVVFVFFYAIFDTAVGLDQLRLVHLNDSVKEFGSGRDHHDHLGLGKIGLEGLRLIMNSKLAKVPMIMETPIDERRENHSPVI